MAFNLGGQKKGSIRPSMNVTPLVDVVLVLLIIFMVVTPMLIKHLSLDIPAKPPENPPPPPAGALPPIVVQLRADRSISINREATARESLVPQLQRMLNARPDKVVFFDAADGSPFGDAVELLDQVRGGGISMIAVLPESPL